MQDEEEQLQYTDMLIDVSMNRNSAQCHAIQDMDDNISTLGLPFMKYYTEAEHDDAVEWLYPGGQLDFSATILCCNNKSINMWNAVAQKINPSQKHMLRLKDSFTEADDPRGHLKKMLSGPMLNGFQKNGIPDHELILKVSDICLVTRAINGLGLANNSRICIVAIHRHCVEV